MKILYSNFLNFPQSLVSPSSVEMAKISNFLMQKWGFETIFVGDTKSIEVYKSVPYNKIIEFDDRINHIPECMWSAGKLIALSMMTEPVIHMDFDLLFLNPPDNRKLFKPIVCLHSEHNLKERWQILYNNYLSVRPWKTSGIEITSYNSGIIGGLNIKLIKSCTNELINFITEKKYEIQKIFISLNSKMLKGQDKLTNISAVLLEQIWLYQLFKYNKQNIDLYLVGDPCVKNDNSFCELNVNAMNEGVLHLQGFKNDTSTKFVFKQMCEIFKI